MARRARRCGGRAALTLLACLSVVAVVQPASSLPPRRDLFFDETPRDGDVVTAERGADVVLDCQAIGTPIPTVHWLHRGRRIIQVPACCEHRRTQARAQPWLNSSGDKKWGPG